MTPVTAPGRAAVTDVRVRGTDRKLYSAVRLTPEQRDRAIDAAHHLVCRKGMTIRAARAAMASLYGIRRSTGSIHSDLVHFACEVCHDPGLND